MKILIFLHGTIVMHSSGISKTREERVLQVINNDPSICNFDSYIPINKAAEKIQSWSSQGAEIIYLSSHQNSEDVEKDRIVLKKYGFPDGKIAFRQLQESYGDIVEKIKPDILIEDDCESIGGEKEMVIISMKSNTRKNIKSIIINEFGGIDFLADNINDLVVS
jgi:hypothetical protein